MTDHEIYMEKPELYSESIPDLKKFTEKHICPDCPHCDYVPSHVQNDPVLKMMLEDLEDDDEDVIICTECGGQGGYNDEFKGTDICHKCDGQGFITN